MSRRYSVLIPFLLIISGCSNLGRSMPECDGGQTGTVIIEIQSVPGSFFIPCINALDAGWDFHDVEPRSGLSTFSLDSDRLGDPFLTVLTTSSCDISDAVKATSDERSIDLYKDVVEDLAVPLIIIPEGASDETLAAARSVVVATFGLRMNHRSVDARIDAGEESTRDRIAAAHSAGSHVITISLRDAEDGTVSLLLAQETEERTGLRLDQALGMVEDQASPPSYIGSWFYVFEGGCTEYRFDAAGPGAEDVAADVQGSLSFIDAEAIKQVARQAGYDIP
jgi:hypothetical protein